MQDKKILIVADESITAIQIKKLLTKLGFKTILIVDTGNEAIKKIEELKTDLILMDIGLKGNMDGIIAAQRINQHFDVPIIYLTTFCDDKTFRKAKLTKPYGFIVKPFESYELKFVLDNAFYRFNLEKELRETKDILEVKVENRTAKLNILINELKRSNEELQQFAYVASHDLQEPLRTISSFTQLLELRYKDKLDSDADEFLTYIMEASKRMKQMINDLLEYSRVMTKGNEFKPVNMEEILDRAIFNLKAAINENNAEITHDPLPYVTADPGQLTKVFQNLIGNAIKFRKPHVPSRVHISAFKYNYRNEYCFSVSDNGIGIDPKFTERIFTIFQRLHTLEEYDGTGIGLAITKRVIERHEGKLWVESELDKGSIFYFTIPIKK